MNQQTQKLTLSLTQQPANLQDTVKPTHTDPGIWSCKSCAQIRGPMSSCDRASNLSIRFHFTAMFSHTGNKKYILKKRGGGGGGGGKPNAMLWIMKMNKCGTTTSISKDGSSSICVCLFGVTTWLQISDSTTLLYKQQSFPVLCIEGEYWMLWNKANFEMHTTATCHVSKASCMTESEHTHTHTHIHTYTLTHI